VEIIDVAPGLWIWRLEHPEWREGLGWEPPVTSTVVESGVEVAVLDGIVPPAEASELWERLDARPPTLAVVLKPDHVPRRRRLRPALRRPCLWAVVVLARKHPRDGARADRAR